MSDFEKEIHNMFDHIWDCEIDHPVYQDTVGELMEAVIQAYEKHNLTHGTNLAEVGTDCISREQAIDAVMECYDNDELFEVYEWKLNELPPIQPETAKRIIGKSRGGMTLWYQCNVCNEPVDEKDAYCRGCGRRLIDG